MLSEMYIDGLIGAENVGHEGRRWLHDDLQRRRDAGDPIFYQGTQRQWSKS